MEVAHVVILVLLLTHVVSFKGAESHFDWNILWCILHFLCLFLSMYAVFLNPTYVGKSISLHYWNNIFIHENAALNWWLFCTVGAQFFQHNEVRKLIWLFCITTCTVTQAIYNKVSFRLRHKDIDVLHIVTNSHHTLSKVIILNSRLCSTHTHMHTNTNRRILQKKHTNTLTHSTDDVCPSGRFSSLSLVLDYTHRQCKHQPIHLSLITLASAFISRWCRLCCLPAIYAPNSPLPLDFFVLFICGSARPGEFELWYI